MRIVNMTADHVAQVAELEKICFGTEAWSERSVASELTNSLSLWLVAEEEGNVWGYVGSQTVMDETDMMNIAVHPEHRKQGIAATLVNNLVDVLKTRGSHSLMLEVRASNDPARKLYDKLGFQQVGLRKNYYRNPKEDACILRKDF